MNCTSCGGANDADARFCVFCGQRVAAESTTPAPQPQMPPPMPPQAQEVPAPQAAWQPGAQPPPINPAPAQAAASYGQGTPPPMTAAPTQPGQPGQPGQPMATMPAVQTFQAPTWWRQWGPSSAQLTSDAKALAVGLLPVMGVLALVFSVVLHHSSRFYAPSFWDTVRAGFGAAMTPFHASLYGGGDAWVALAPASASLLMGWLTIRSLRASAQALPSRTWQAVVVRALVDGLMVGVVCFVLALVLRGDKPFVADPARLATSLPSAFFATTILVALLSTFAQGLHERQDVSPVLRSALARWWNTAGLILRAFVWSFVVLLAAMLVATVYEMIANQVDPRDAFYLAQMGFGDTDSDTVLAALLALVFFGVNIVTTLGGFALGISGSTDVSALSPGRSSSHEAAGIFTAASASTWLLGLVPIVCWLVVIGVAARRAAREPGREQSTGLRIAHTMGASVATVLALAWISSVTVRQRHDSGLGFGLDLGTAVLVACLLGGLLVVGSTIGMPVLAGQAPGLAARVAGKKIHPAWAQLLVAQSHARGKAMAPWVYERAGYQVPPEAMRPVQPTPPASGPTQV